MAAIFRRKIDTQSKQWLLKLPADTKSLLSGSSREFQNHHFATNLLVHRRFILSTYNFSIFKRLFTLIWQQGKKSNKNGELPENQSDQHQDNGQSKVELLEYSLFRPYGSVPVQDVQTTQSKSFPFFDPNNFNVATQPAVENAPQTKDIDIEAYRAEIIQANENFLQSFPKSLDKMSKNLLHPSNVKIKPRKKPAPTPRESSQDKKILYPLIKTPIVEKRREANFESVKNFLESLNIPTDQLEYYPDIQNMSNNEILDCLVKLKEYGIVRVFNLFFISRVHLELSCKGTSDPNSHILKSGKRKLLCFKQVQSYVELCQVLQTPDLDINGLLESLASFGIYDDIHTILNKAKKLISVGATPKDLLNNLELFKGYEFFYEKIDLYKSIKLPTIVSSFPVNLFLSKTTKAFKEQLAIDFTMKEIADLLDVKLLDLQACWSLWNLNATKLKYKVQMCLNAGISKQDIFNNLKMLNKFPIEKCHAATVCFQESGLPVSVYLLHEMEKTREMNGVSDRTTQAVSTAGEMEDWTGNNTEVPPLVEALSKDKVRKSYTCTKMLRRQMVYLVVRKLSLDSSSRISIFDCDIDVTGIDIQDVTRNFDFLLSAGFTRDQLATCPIILMNQSEKLISIARNIKDLAQNYLHSSSCSLVSSEAVAAHLESDLVADDACVFKDLFKCPTKHLNTIQYFLEKEKTFSLATNN
nr:hypothetical protein BgiMline_028712 [Biomphalaria glabrata]